MPASQLVRATHATTKRARRHSSSWQESSIWGGGAPAQTTVCISSKLVGHLSGWGPGNYGLYIGKHLGQVCSRHIGGMSDAVRCCERGALNYSVVLVCESELSKERPKEKRPTDPRKKARDPNATPRTERHLPATHQPRWSKNGR